MELGSIVFQPLGYLDMAKTKKLWGCQPALLHPNPEQRAVLEYLCGEANKVYNCAVYYARQVYFKTKRFPGRAEICSVMKWNRHFSAMYVSSAQQVCNGVAESFKGFRELLKLFYAGELAERPKPPNYRDKGLFTVSYPVRWLKLTDEGVRIPLGLKVKTWFDIASIHIPMPSNLDWKTIREVRILPRNGCFYAEFVYPLVQQPAELDPGKAIGIDHGIDNWLVCVSTVGTSFIVDGRHLKAINQFYNKRVATLKEGRNQDFWSKQLAAITEKRNRQMRDAVNKAARLVVNHCLERGIGTVVFGWNQGQKSGSKMGFKNNQKFVQIPTARLKKRVEQLCQQYGIQFIETEESYTSQASFIDGDFLPTYGEKPDQWKSSGKRVKRGLFRTAMNWYVNADANGAANVIRKVSMTLGLDLSGMSRGALTSPARVRFWSTCESPCLQTGE
jgi:IS605 OrfB family transposase